MSSYKELLENAMRYTTVRSMEPREFERLKVASVEKGVSFDALVDGYKPQTEMKPLDDIWANGKVDSHDNSEG
jgi:hypothetical protein